jgi:AraC family transcriptional regulator, regulatory protein of adaptative response / methylated-DNA-[protein]-cysteine methyltransferase
VIREAAPTDAHWQALTERDRTLDGCFVYVAVTTSIYCRPSCPARLPRRQYVVILPTAADAEHRGYSACRRCRPESSVPANNEASVEAALSLVTSQAGEAVPLLALSQAVGLSPNHLQRTFSRIVGISPRSLRDHQALVRLKRLLRAGTSVAEAVYDAGYGSIRAVYERARRDLGMTPAVYRRGGKGIGIRYALGKSSLGRALVGATPTGVCALLRGTSDRELAWELRCEFPRATLNHQARMPPLWAEALLHAQREDPLMQRQPLEVRSAVFEARVRHFVRDRAR